MHLVLNISLPVTEIKYEITKQIDSQFLIDDLEDTSSPLEYQLREAAEGTGIGHIGCVWHCHGWNWSQLFWKSLDLV